MPGSASWRRATKPDRPWRRNPSGGGSFGRGLRWLVPYSPLRGCSELAALSRAKIPRRRHPRIFETGSEMSFCDDDFLLSNGPARELYHGVAAGQPIIDYHCHIPPRDLAEDRQFNNIQEVWLEGDHYKWRAMRACGVPEALITGGDTSPREKFQAWAVTAPKTLRNPLFHWTHLELRRHFGI